MKTYSGLRAKFGDLAKNSSTETLRIGDELINDSLRYLTTKYFFNERTQVVPGGTVAGQQAYDLPFNIKTILNVYVSVGNIRYQLTECPTRQTWDSLNFVPYTSDIPQYYFIYNKKINIFPTPATSSNVITINYKIRLMDLSVVDYTSATNASTITVTNGDSTITGSGTAVFTNTMPGRWFRATQPLGDGQWYEIASYISPTVLELVNQYQGPTNSGCSYTIGEVPILPEDYQDLPVYRALAIYYTSRVPNQTSADLYQKLYDEGFAALDAEFGSKSNSVAITPADNEIVNPNLYTRSLS